METDGSKSGMLCVCMHACAILWTVATHRTHPTMLCMCPISFLHRDGTLPDLPQCSVAFNNLLKVCMYKNITYITQGKVSNVGMCACTAHTDMCKPACMPIWYNSATKGPTPSHLQSTISPDPQERPSASQLLSHPLLSSPTEKSKVIHALHCSNWPLIRLLILSPPPPPCVVQADLQRELNEEKLRNVMLQRWEVTPLSSCTCSGLQYKVWFCKLCMYAHMVGPICAYP